jgi:AraC family transcriptional regulator of adaptative response/methylated-DNA-[protein]-cysteine methyltransferase
MVPSAASRPAASLLDPEIAWEAVLHRDASWDGRFVFSVRSTGIYCRPSCPARRARRDRVEFHETPAGAEAAGFRACLRCHPAEGDGRQPAARLEAAREYLAAHLDQSVTLSQLGRVVGLSPTHLQRRFRQQFGVSPREFVEALRMREVKTHLKRGETVTRATFEAGFGAGSRLYAQGDSHLGMTPGAFRGGGAGMVLGVAIVESAAGPLLVATTDRGLAAVMLGQSPEELESALAAEYPQAIRRRDDAALTESVAAVVASIEGRRRSASLDVQGTDFELRVWKALREIPRGTTRTYGEVAAALGQPTAARAVARACAANRLAIVVPCHRVVRADGDSGGYRWGAETKRRLLALEGAPSGPDSAADSAAQPSGKRRM